VVVESSIICNTEYSKKHKFEKHLTTEGNLAGGIEYYLAFLEKQIKALEVNQAKK
jgi:hypothetical protein